MAKCEPRVENYLGFPEGLRGEELLRLGRRQAKQCNVVFVKDEVKRASVKAQGFLLSGRRHVYHARWLLLATGIFHLPPEIPGVRECVGESILFCKDCDGIRVRGKRIAIYGNNNEAAEYALAMLTYSPHVAIVTNKKRISWNLRHWEWLRKYKIPIHEVRIKHLEHRGKQVSALVAEDTPRTRIAVDYIFTVRGEVFHNRMASQLGADLGPDGHIKVDECMRTNVPNLYAAGCITPANCQIAIAVGQGATAAQAINRAMFFENLERHTLPLA